MTVTPDEIGFLNLKARRLQRTHYTGGTLPDGASHLDIVVILSPISASNDGQQVIIDCRHSMANNARRFMASAKIICSSRRNRWLQS